MRVKIANVKRIFLLRNIRKEVFRHAPYVPTLTGTPVALRENSLKPLRNKRFLLFEMFSS